MVVWGGDASLETRRAPFNTGGHYDPRRDAWRATETRGAPPARSGHSAVWTGHEMVIWGGQGENGVLSDGAAYDPGSRRWTLLPSTGAPLARSGHRAFWTGSEMIVWGGQGSDGVLQDGARWDPTSRRWKQVAAAGAPSARSGFVGVWTGSEMLVWGGEGTRGSLGDGGGYDVALDRWRPLSRMGAPSARVSSVAVWTGSEMLVWGGRRDPRGDDLSDGAAFSPAADRWRPLPAKGWLRRTGLVAVWTGQALLAVGEVAEDVVYPFREAGILRPREGRWSAHRVGFGWHEAAAVWTGRAALLWGGFDGTNVLNQGIRLVP